VQEGGNENDETSIAEAVALAKESDLVICVVGEEAFRSGEAASYANIHLPGNQEKLIDALIATEKRIVLLVASGRPLILTNFNKRVNALMNVWQLGTCAGAAIADLIVGKVNPSGRITLSFPRGEGQIPIYYNHHNTGRPLYKTDRFKTCYLDMESTPLYPFGYGLSFTNFVYENIRLSDTVMGANGEITVSLTVKNIGDRDGATVVQMYIRDLVGSRVRPVKELKGFEKVFLKVGESPDITLKLPASALAFHDADMNLVVEAGKFKLWIAENAQDNSREFDFEVR
jgi:beta-glucosidase